MKIALHLNMSRKGVGDAWCVACVLYYLWIVLLLIHGILLVIYRRVVLI